MLRLLGSARRRRILLEVVLLLALAAIPRAVYVTATSPVRSSDEADYQVLAITFRQHGVLGFAEGRPSAFFPPLYPMFLALFVRDGEIWTGGVFTIQVALGAASAGIAYLLGRRLQGPAAGWIAGLFVASQVPMIKMAGHFLSESLAVFLLLATLGATAEALRRRSAGWAAAAGMGAALAALTRAAALPWIAGVCLVCFTIRPRRRSLLLAASALAGFLLFHTPWAVRNWHLSERYLPATAQEEGARRHAFLIAELLEDGQDVKTASRLAMGRWGALQAVPDELDAATHWLHLRHRFLVMTGLHPGLRLPLPLTGQRIAAPPLLAVFHYAWWLTLWLGLATALVLWLTVWRSAEWWPLFLLPALLLALHVAVHALPRYQWPIGATWSVAAGCGLAFVLTRAWRLAREGRAVRGRGASTRDGARIRRGEAGRGAPGYPPPSSPRQPRR